MLPVIMFILENSKGLYFQIRLGTFKSEKEAAAAYDSAALRLRSGDFHRNFPWTDLTMQELNFQNIRSIEAVLDMIKEGSYQSKFADFLRTRIWNEEKEIDHNLLNAEGNGDIICRLLFKKELTPSDVGKLNRLVIPKKYAIKFFPPFSGKNDENMEGNAMDDVELVFHDRLMRTWKIRYCFWGSSQSFVFTGGWNRFVREKELKVKDKIAFYMCRLGNGEGPFCMIDVCEKYGSSVGLLKSVC